MALLLALYSVLVKEFGGFSFANSLFLLVYCRILRIFLFLRKMTLLQIYICVSMIIQKKNLNPFGLFPCWLSIQRSTTSLHKIIMNCDLMKMFIISTVTNQNCFLLFWRTNEKQCKKKLSLTRRKSPRKQINAEWTTEIYCHFHYCCVD